MVTSEAIEASLERLRIFLAIDGGNVQLVQIKENGVVEVRLLGSCIGCPMSLMTLRAGIERALMIEHPEVKRVEQVK
ncbi:MAG: NifU family protein [Ignavibacteriae bacterium]|nr:MAG: NifU family protein [Ignavibacteriota bacterium]